MPQTKFEKIILEYDSKDGGLVYGYWAWILKEIGKRNRIPARVITKLYSLFKVEGKKRKIKTEIVSQLTNTTIQRFNQYKYNFKREKSNSRNLLDEDYSFEDMIKSICSFVIEPNERGIINKNKFPDKETIIRKIYLRLTWYKEVCQIPEKNLSHYRRCVLASFISTEVGYSVTSVKNPSASRLFHPANNIINKSKEKNKIIFTL